MTAEQLEKIKWLNRAFYAEKAAKAWLAKLERDRSLAERLSRCSAGTGNGNGAGNSTQNSLIRLAETERETGEKLAALCRIRDEITEAVAAVDDPDLQAVLVRHYLAYETWEVVAEQMHYSVRSIRYKHKAALDKVCIVLHPEM